MKKTYVYLVADTSAINNFVKIGKTDNIEKRMRDYSTHNPSYKLIGFCRVKNPVKEKKAQKWLKKQFGVFQVENTEWYRIENSVLFNALTNRSKALSIIPCFKKNIFWWFD